MSIKLAILLLGASVLIQCNSVKNANNTQKGAVIGAAGGAVIGGVLGNNVGKGGRGAEGAILGGIIGGVTGGLIGRQMDKQAEEMKAEIPDAVVVRVEEGIVVEFNSQILFGFDKSGLTADAKRNLDNLEVILQKYPDTDIEIQGHTDNIGASKYNLELSEQRAKMVYDVLIRFGTSSKQLRYKGYGDVAPHRPGGGRVRPAG